MNKTSYQVSDASIKRYWELRKPKTENEYTSDLRPIDIFNKWAKQENFCKFTYWDALQKIAQEDYWILDHVMYMLKDKTQKLNKIAEAFEIINDLNANNQ
tara:strand:- start:455 stop:754 length:300 start_codon:yes stop_codon:yes gene_type:complete